MGTLITKITFTMYEDDPLLESDQETFQDLVKSEKALLQDDWSYVMDIVSMSEDIEINVQYKAGS